MLREVPGIFTIQQLAYNIRLEVNLLYRNGSFDKITILGLCT